MVATADLSLSQSMKRAHRTPTIATGTTKNKKPELRSNEPATNVSNRQNANGHRQTADQSSKPE